MSLAVRGLWLVALGLAACGPGDAVRPEHVPLAGSPLTRDMVRQVPSMLATWNARLDLGTPLRARPVEEGAALWIERAIPMSAWERTEIPGMWKTPAVLGSHGEPADGSMPLRLLKDGQDMDFLMDQALVEAMRKTVSTSVATPDVFFEYRDELYAGFERPPARMTHRVFVRLDEVLDGQRRVSQKRFAGDGVAVLPGMHAELTVGAADAVGADGPRVLRVATVAQGELVELPDADFRVRFRITWNGEPLLDEEQPVPEGGTVVWHALPLPARSTDDPTATLRLEVDGPPALTAFLCPAIGPATGTGAGSATGADADKPSHTGPTAEAPRRPDVVLFLADTFRADNMSTYGGLADVTPHIDAFAGEARRFLRTWSPASWTLPAHASMFSGVYPFQHDALEGAFALEQDVVTMAEQMRAAGYRTGAVTDALLVSHNNGLDQGFEWWDEHAVDLDDTLRRVSDFLDADDGRPVFLFVHTYSIHAPYTVSDETRASHAERLDLGHDMNELLRDIRLGEEAEAGSPKERRAERARRRYHDRYLGAVVDLDRAFGRFLELLARHGIDEHGYTIFTSDHGEAFGEHGHLGHGEGVWEEDVRIPLLVRGPGMPPGDVTWAASLLDLPRTVAALTGVEPAAGWLGASLQDLAEERPVFSFQARRRSELLSRIAMIHAQHKLITVGDGREVGRIDTIYDLGSDPAEQLNLIDDPPAWYRALDERLRPLARALMVPIYSADTQLLTAEQQADLRALGYADF